MTRLAYAASGPPNAPVLLAGPSLGSTAAVWERQVAPFAATHRFVRFELPGHGESAPPTGAVSITDLGRMVLEILDDLAVPRASYVGVSIGGMIGLSVAVTAPPRIDRLILVCTSAHLPPADGWLDRAARVRREGPEAVADVVVERWFTTAFRRANPSVVAQFRAMIAGTDPEGYAACCEAIADMDLRPVLPTIATPTLVIAGREDPAAPPAHSEQIAAAIPGARLNVLDNAAHLANVERAAEVTALMTGFLEAR